MLPPDGKSPIEPHAIYFPGPYNPPPGFAAIKPMNVTPPNWRSPKGELFGTTMELPPQQPKQTKRCANCKSFVPYPESVIEETKEQIEHIKLKNSAQEYDLGINYTEEENEDDPILLPYHGVCRHNPLKLVLTTDVDAEEHEVYNEITFEEIRTRKNYYCSHHQLGEYEGPPYEDFAKED